MTVNISSDRETDRMLSLRASSRIPLPPEIALSDPEDARDYFGWLTYYEIFGVSDHPFVKQLSKRRLDAAVASAVSRATHLDRVSHYSAWMGGEAVRIIPPVTSGEPHTEGGDERGRSPSESDPHQPPTHAHRTPIPMVAWTRGRRPSGQASIKAVVGVAALPQPRRPTFPVKIT